MPIPITFLTSLPPRLQSGNMPGEAQCCMNLSVSSQAHFAIHKDIQLVDDGIPLRKELRKVYVFGSIWGGFRKYHSLWIWAGKRSRALIGSDRRGKGEGEEIKAFTVENTSAGRASLRGVVWQYAMKEGSRTSLTILE